MDKMIVIKEQADKFYNELRDELFVTGYKIFSPCPFVEYLIKTNKTDIEHLYEYIWILSSEVLGALKYGQKDVAAYSDSFYYDLPNNEEAVFKIGLTNASTSNFTAFILEIVKSPKPLDDNWSICVDDANYVDN